MNTVVEEEESFRNLSDEYDRGRPKIKAHKSGMIKIGAANQGDVKKPPKGDCEQTPPASHQQTRSSAFENVMLKVMRRPSVVPNLMRGSRRSSHGTIDGNRRTDAAEIVRGTSSKSEMSLILPKPPQKSASPVLQNRMVVRRPSGAVTFNPSQINIYQKRYILGLLHGSNNSLPEFCRDVAPNPPKPEEPSGSFTDGNDACITGMSALYAKLLFVLGIAFPVSEVLSSAVPTHYYQGFYLFLYLGSLGFMVFMYVTLVKDRALYKLIKSSLDVEEDEFNRLRTQRKNKKLLLNPVQYGSFYLRLGAVAFGVGSMVYSGLEFGQYFETKNNSQCHNLIRAITPVARMVLTLAQMQFIFINSKQIEMSKSRGIARFGLMHLVATNLCEWLNVIVEEAKHEIVHLAHAVAREDTQEATTIAHDKGHVMNKREADHDIFECQRASVIGSLVQDASPFLFPCTIEYSLICAVIMYEMWKDIKKASYKEDVSDMDLGEKGMVPPRRTSSSTDVQESKHHFSVDCSNAHKGLFSGILVLVMTITSLIMFFVMEKDRTYHSLAVYEVNVCELILYSISIVAVLLGGWKMRYLKFNTEKRVNEGIGLDNTLLMWAQAGVYVYCMFSIIASFFMIDHNSPGGFITEVFSLIQTTSQTAFILDATFRTTDKLEHHKDKPGRQIITFLLVSNMALWLVNTLQKNRAEFRPTHLEFYGFWAWTIITHVSMPLSIFYSRPPVACNKRNRSFGLAVTQMESDQQLRPVHGDRSLREIEDSGSPLCQQGNEAESNKHLLKELENDTLNHVQTILVRHQSDEALTTILSAFYGKLLVVMGVAFPVIDALASETLTRFNGFYLYLNMGSIFFLIYTYGLMMKEEAFQSITTGSEISGYIQGPRHAFLQRQVRFGSNYLRMGVAGFGIGSMIFSGLEFGRYFEMSGEAECQNILIAISPLSRIIFVLMQMLFVFSNNKLLNDRIYKIIARFGLMHMIAANLCEWLYVLVEETKLDILNIQTHEISCSPESDECNKSKTPRMDNLTFSDEITDDGNNTASDLLKSCWNTYLMGTLLKNSSTYLFPCTVEYSLLCAVILAVMWNNVCKTDYYDVLRSDKKIGRLGILDERGIMMLKDRQSGVNIIYSRSVHKFSVDCASSHKGLFSGILVLVLTIISLIMFFELAEVNIELAVLQVNIWETTLFGTAITATVACAVILRNIDFRKRHRRFELEHILLLVTQCGVFLYFLFQILGGYYSLQNGTNGDPWRLLRLVTPIAALVQSSCQTILVLDAWRRRCSTTSQVRRKPGRELVTFLLITNLALWAVNRLKNNSAEFHPMQIEFYGVWAWTVITHVSMPLVVCYRFQSTVCLYEIWQHVYKSRSSDRNEANLHTIESKYGLTAESREKACESV